VALDFPWYPFQGIVSPQKAHVRSSVIVDFPGGEHGGPDFSCAIAGEIVE